MNRLKFKEDSGGLRHWRYIYSDGTRHIVLIIDGREDKITDWMARENGDKFWYRSVLNLNYAPVQLMPGVVAEIYEAGYENETTLFRAEINVLPGSGSRYACEVRSTLKNDRLTVIAHNHVDDWSAAIEWCDMIATVHNPYELARLLKTKGHK